MGKQGLKLRVETTFGRAAHNGLIELDLHG